VRAPPTMTERVCAGWLIEAPVAPVAAVGDRFDRTPRRPQGHHGFLPG
jgi:hypothetical protein